MALVLKGGGIFLHIPKTGGNWVTEVLEKCDLVEGKLGPKHADIDRVLCPVFNSSKKLLKYYWNNRRARRERGAPPFMFCFVRHPLKWYESWFKYMSQPSREWVAWGDEVRMHRWHPNAILNGLGAPEFNQFVRNVVEKRPGYVTEMFGWYTMPQTQFVGRQENLRADLVTALKMQNLKFDEKFVLEYEEVGVSPEPKMKVEWDPELKERVRQLELAGLARYGYEKSFDFPG